MEMSTLMQAQALYSTQLAIANANKKTGTEASKELAEINLKLQTLLKALV
jgi:hypothetical protein